MPFEPAPRVNRLIIETGDGMRYTVDGAYVVSYQMTMTSQYARSLGEKDPILTGAYMTEIRIDLVVPGHIWRSSTEPIEVDDQLPPPSRRLLGN